MKLIASIFVCFLLFPVQVRANSPKNEKQKPRIVVLIYVPTCQNKDYESFEGIIFSPGRSLDELYDEHS